MASGHAFVILDNIPSSETITLRSVKLPHPKYGEVVSFLASSTNLYEIQQSSKEPSSWFIGDTVKQDGNLFIATNMDPLFLAVSFLRQSGQARKNSQHSLFQPLKQLFCNEDFPDLKLLSLLISPQKLACVCDVQEGWDEDVFRFSQEKALVWLRRKVERVSLHLLASDLLPFGAGATPQERKPEAVKMAVAFISEYLDTSMQNLLFQSYSLDVQISQKQEGNIKGWEKYEKSSLNTVTGDKDVSQSNVETPKHSLKPEQTKKVKPANVTGMKSISAYFTASTATAAGPKKKKKKI